MKLNKIYKISGLAICLLSLISMVGCKKTDKSDPVLPSGNMAQVIKSSTAYWATNVAIERGGIANQITGEGPFTGFVLSNLGWRSIGYPVFAGINQTTGTTDTLNRVKPEILGAVAGYMFGLGKLDTASLPNIVNGEITTINGKILYCSKVAATLTFNGGIKRIRRAWINGHLLNTINITYPNNGIMHELGEIILPPIGTIAESIDSIVLQKDTTLTLLKAAIIKASTATGAGSVNLAAILASNGPYTLFAPNNVAFRAYPGAIFNSIAKINALSGPNLDLLNKTLQFHVIPQRMFTSFWIDYPLTEVSATNSFSTLLPNQKVFLLGNNNLRGNAQQTAIAGGAGGVNVNRTCTNGVIHKIGAILRPQ